MTYQEDSGSRYKRWCEWPRGAKIALIAAAAIVLVPAFFVLFGCITMWLWNWLMPTIFHLPAISFWQAWGINILSHILFKGGRMGRAGKRHWKKEKIRERMGEEGPEAKPQAE